MNYDLGQRVSKMLTSSAKPAPLNYAPSKQKMSTYPSTPTDNLRKQGVGVTSVGVKARSVTNKPTGGAMRKMYPVNIVNKAKAQMGWNSGVDAK